MSLSQKSYEKLNEWIKWWNWHSTMIPAQPQDKQIAFLLKAVNGLFDMVVEVAREADRMDRNKFAVERLSDAGLVIPKEVKWEGK